MAGPKRIPRVWLVVWLSLPFVIVALLWILVLEPSRVRARTAAHDDAARAKAATQSTSPDDAAPKPAD